MTNERVRLEDAYALQSSADARDLYARWAATYESDFVAGNGYIIPDQVADVFADVAGRLAGPVLDVGCGTGLVGLALVRDTAGEGVEWEIDGIDISSQMLERAGEKVRPDGTPLYRTLIEADVTEEGGRIPVGDGTYAGVLSAGTFTHGHLGPDALSNLIRLGRPGAIFAIGINAEHFADLGFGDRIRDELSNGRIRNLDPRIVQMYREGSEHAAETAVVAVFRRA